MGVFSGIESAEVYGGGANIRPGMHVLEVKELLVHNSRKKAGVVFFIAEMAVIESTGGRPLSAKESNDAPPVSDAHAPGEVVSWVVDLSQPSGLSNVKGFAMALAPGMTEADITEETMSALVESKQPARGVVVRCDAFVELTRKGGDFTKTRWTTAAAIAA